MTVVQIAALVSVALGGAAVATVSDPLRQTLVLGIDIRVQKAADHGFEASGFALTYCLAHRLDVQWLQHLPLGVHAFADAKAPAPWY